MTIEIYYMGGSNPVILKSWTEFFTYFTELPTYTMFCNSFEFWNPIENCPISNEKVFEHLAEIQRVKTLLNNLATATI